MKGHQCELWVGTRTGAFFRLGTFDSVAAARRYVQDCDLTCYKKIVKIKNT